MNKARLSVVPPGWVERHRPIVEGFFLDTVTLERPVDTKGDEFGGQRKQLRPLTEQPIPANVQMRVDYADRDRESAGIPLLASDYLIRLPVTAPRLRRHDVVTIDTSPDLSQVGLEFAVEVDESQTFAVDASYHLKRVQDPNRQAS